MKSFAVYVMKFIVILVVAVILIRILHGTLLPATITLNLPGQGKIQASYSTTTWTNQTFMSFLAIPYAESPSRKLRFKHAVKKLPWRHVLDATTYGRRCPVITSLAGMTQNELKQDLEDCLNLCVYTKTLKAQQPVMFYIYGGGFTNGSNIDHPPDFLLEKDIVLVVPNYRVGALGWLSIQNENMPGNSPVSDLYMALRWVQDYIYLFGGDPKQVTIFGQSAGAAISGALLLSPKTYVGYFHRSIQQSGSIFSPWAINRRPMEQAERICKNLKCQKCELLEEIFKCLQNVSVPLLLQTTKQESFKPVIGDFYGILPKEPKELFTEYNRSIPLMTGFTKHDGSFVLASVYDSFKAAVGNFSNVTVREFSNTLFTAVKEDTGIANNMLSKMLFTNDLLYSKDHKSALPAYFDLTSIIAMKSPVITLARNMFTKNLADVYLYTFDYEGSNTRFGYEFGNDHYPFDGGVHHSNENIYLFSTHVLNDLDTKMSHTMVEIWTSFASTGKPSLSNQVKILPMSTEAGPYVHIKDNITWDYDVLQELTATLDDPDNNKLNRHNQKF